MGPATTSTSAWTATKTVSFPIFTFSVRLVSCHQIRFRGLASDANQPCVCSDGEFHTMHWQHRMSLSANKDAWKCDGCAKLEQKGATNRYRCMAGCDFDLCYNCWYSSDRRLNGMPRRLLLSLQWFCYPTQACHQWCAPFFRSALRRS